MHTRAVIALALIAMLPRVGAREPTAPKTKVPAWDARGVGPLPWQEIACIDVNDDASRIAIGTIAPPGDPNVILLDGNGKVLRAQHAGQRWIEQVALEGDAIRALCTMPAGKAGDNSEVFRLSADAVELEKINWRRTTYPEGYFHYGDHSNHVTRLLIPGPGFADVVNGDQLQWYSFSKKEGRTSSFQLGDGAIPVSAARWGHVSMFVGTTAAPSDRNPTPANLHLLNQGSKEQDWSRPINTETAEAPRPEKGRYGTPTLPDGRRDELPQRDQKVWAPLAVGAYIPPLLGESSFAVADYQGWQRLVRSSATGKDENLGVRFTPSRPAVTIYSERKKVVRRFGPETFVHPLWCDLRFLNGDKLLVSPHSWTSRGLAGQPRLPADDDANDLYVLGIKDGKVSRFTFPDAIADLGLCAGEPIVVSCWDGRVYRLSEADLIAGKLPAGIEVGGPGIVRATLDGKRIVVAGHNGVVRMLDGAGKELWQTDLNKAVKPGLKTWVEKARAMPIADGIWQLPGGRVESDLGGQRLIEAPDGLILIEAHAGLSFESEWAAIKAVGLDPMRVKYVLATHEHGDHAPGAYLWRVVTGAKFVCSEEMAYTLQHHTPLNSGYGFHPPNPTDIAIKEDTDLDLAGLKVRAVRIPGHTAGSMAWYFEKGGKSYVSFGDLIMPRGVLGYSGSINFSATDVLASLRKLQALKPDIVLPGHGAVGPPGDTLAAGVEVGIKGSWGLIKPEKPDPYSRVESKNVVVAAWNLGATSAAFGDVDGDGRPDVVIVSKSGEGSLVRIFINKGGKFDDKPDHEIPLPQVAEPHKVRVLPAAKGSVADLFVAGKSAALLHADGKLPNYKVVSIDTANAHQVRIIDNGDRKQTLILNRFGAAQALDESTGKPRLTKFEPEVSGPYVDVRSVDLNGDGRPDLVTSYGLVFLRGAHGKLPLEPTLRLPVEKGEWHYLAVGDFNGDRRPDIVLLSYGMNGQTTARVFYNTGKADRPFNDKPDAVIPLNAHGRQSVGLTLLRDTPVVCDWNGDGVDDLVIGRGQSQEVLILLGGRDGLDAKRSQTIALDYRVHYETGLYVDDFDGDGVPDLAAFGYTLTGVGWNGPPAAYIWKQPRRER
jgi:metallo-beta-lactamase class B